MRFLLPLLLFLSAVGPSLAADSLNTITILPIYRNTLDNQSGTIAVTNTFQKVFSLSTTRFGCTLQNNGTHSMWVFFGATGSATAGSAVVLAAGQAIYCQSSAGLTYQGEIAITGTSGDAFYAAAQ